MFDLTTEAGRKALAKRISSDVDEACVEHFREGPRTHLGASIIGHECARYGWNVFRWLKHETFKGRMYRLFERGHLEEPRFVKWLRLIGFVVHEFDAETDKQYRITGAKGHFGGSLDSIAYAPARYGLGDTPLLPEYKTHKNSSFNEVKKHGVQMSKPQHFKQMCSYGRPYGIEYGLYCAVNKDTDELHYEIVKLDYSLSDDLFRKADSIIFTQLPPRKISEHSTFYKCKMCDFAGICHLGDVPTTNCRSCEHARPIEDKQWWCDLHSPQANEAIPKDVIPVGCASWRRIV